MPHALTHLSTVACLAFASLFCQDLVARDSTPNVVVILTDDQGWGDLSINGNTNFQTPQIDSLAKQGARFDRFYVCPVCSPTRAEFLTGRYHPRGGVWSTSTGGERLDLDERTIAQVFKAAGYHTAAYGKWHNGSQYPYHPNARGFDDYYGFLSGHWGDYFSPQLEHNGKIVQGNGFTADDFTDHAIDFITQHRNDPFFVYLAFNTPHAPMQVPDPYWDSFKERPIEQRGRDSAKEDVEFTRAALAMVKNVDDNVGRLLQALDKYNLTNDTIVVFFCDNGPNAERYNGDMKGRKGSTDEGGVRSPLHVRWPAKIKAGTEVTQIAGAIDLLPTLADLAGVEVPTDRPLDGKSLRPLMLGESANWPDRMLFSHWNKKVSVRTQRYRLDQTGKLYDMQKDPGQREDVAQQHPDVTARLKAAVNKWSDELLPNLTDDQRSFPVGHHDVAWTHLPARDGVPHGKIQRSSKHPNSTFFMNWVSSEDQVTWDVEVLTSGKYQVELYYACPETSVGTEFELEFNGQKLKGRVEQPNDVPLRGAEHDRIVRTEGYIKDFKPMRLGVITLPAGRGELTLRAPTIKGAQAPEIRMLSLYRE